MTNMTNQPSPAIYGTYPLEMEVLPWVLWDISTRNGGFTMGFMGKSWEYMGITGLVNIQKANRKMVI